MSLLKLIIIEDDENFAYLLRQSLDGLTNDSTVQTVNNWQDAFNLIDKNDHDVAWVDLRMPLSSEQQTVVRIENLRKKNPRIVIIVGSGYITPEIRAQLDHAGVDDCFYKSAQYDSRQVASLIVLGLMKAHKRGGLPKPDLLNYALKWMGEKFPSVSGLTQRTA